MQIIWTSHNIKLKDNRPYSNAASARYRLILPAHGLRTLGHDVRFMQIGLDASPETLDAELAGDVLVISKLAPHTPEILGRTMSLMLDLMRAARSRGLCVAVDVCDNHFDDPSRGAYFKAAVNQCDVVVASTETMAEIVRRHTPVPVRIAGDPYEGERRPERFDPPPPAPSGLLAGVIRSILSGGDRRRPLRLLWFGHESNFESLVALVPDLRRLARRCDVELQVLTSPRPEIVSLCERLDAIHAPALKLRFSPWSVEATWQALDACDIVVIPSSAGDPTKAVKSPNRLVESVRAGRLVCANPVPSYQAFGEFAWIGEDIVEGVEWALDHRHDVIRKLRDGQVYVTRHHSPEAVARQWESAFAGAMHPERRLAPPGP